MHRTHRDRVEALLSDAASEHASLMSRLSPELQASLPVDAQGVTHAIEHLATAAGLSYSERHALIRRTRSIRRYCTLASSDRRRWRGRVIGHRLSAQVVVMTRRQTSWRPTTAHESSWPIRRELSECDYGW